MKFEKSCKLCVGCQDVLTDKQLSDMIVNTLFETGVLPKSFVPGSTIKVEVNLAFSIPDYDLR